MIKENMIELRRQSRMFKWPYSLRFDCKACQLELWLIAEIYIHPTREKNCWGLSDYLALLIDEINKQLGQFIE